MGRGRCPVRECCCKGLQEVVGGVLTNLCASTAISMIECWVALSTGSLLVETRNSEAAKRDSRKGDDIKIWVGNEKKNNVCTVSLCSARSCVNVQRD